MGLSLKIAENINLGWRTKMSKEVNVPCQTFVKTMQCECGGELRHEPTEFTTLQHPLKYKHVCNKCGKVEYYTTTYPIQVSTYEMPEINDENKDGTEN